LLKLKLYIKEHSKKENELVQSTSTETVKMEKRMHHFLFYFFLFIVNVCLLCPFSLHTYENLLLHSDSS